MKKLLLSLLATSVIASSSLFGLGAGCCDWSDCCDLFDGDFFAYGDWLYWNTRRSGLDYIIQNHVVDTRVGTGLPLKKAQTDFTSGYRVGLGYISRCQWGFDVNYTHYNNGDRNIFLSSGPIDGAPTRGEPTILYDTYPQIDSAEMHYTMGYKVLDAAIGYQIKTCCYGIFRPYIGGRFAWINERATTHYQDQTPLVYADLDETTDSQAYGLFAGLDYSNLFLCERFGIFADVGMSVLLGNVKTATYQVYTAATPILTYDLNLKEYRLLSTLDLALGLEGLIFEWCGFSLGGRVGYEFHQWLNMTDFMNLTSDLTFARDNATFGVDGLVVRLVGSF